eukprot:COSAG01_NODE_2649_length_7312_cov_218.427977_7_plen_300_part_00
MEQEDAPVAVAEADDEADASAQPDPSNEYTAPRQVSWLVGGPGPVAAPGLTPGQSLLLARGGWQLTQVADWGKFEYAWIAAARGGFDAVVIDVAGAGRVWVEPGCLPAGTLSVLLHSGVSRDAAGALEHEQGWSRVVASVSEAVAFLRAQGGDISGGSGSGGGGSGGAHQQRRRHRIGGSSSRNSGDRRQQRVAGSAEPPQPLLETARYLGPRPEIPVSFTRKDLITYAVGIGCEEMRFLYEVDRAFEPFPTFPLSLPFKGESSDAHAMPSPAMVAAGCVPRYLGTGAGGDDRIVHDQN